jgi:chloramphenicol-sensitive protein RarD
VPWVALTLAFSFSFYGLLRKMAPVAPLAGLSVETAILFPASLAIALGGFPTLAPALETAHAAFSRGTTALLVASGVVTAIPLLLFAAGARRLRFSTLGFLQYVSPTCQFMLAVLVYREPFSSEKLASFGLIWAALGVYTLETLRHLHRTRRAAQEDVLVPCPE